MQTAQKTKFLWTFRFNWLTLRNKLIFWGEQDEVRFFLPEMIGSWLPCLTVALLAKFNIQTTKSSDQLASAKTCRSTCSLPCPQNMNVCRDQNPANGQKKFSRTTKVFSPRKVQFSVNVYNLWSYLCIEFHVSEIHSLIKIGRMQPRRRGRCTVRVLLGPWGGQKLKQTPMQIMKERVSKLKLPAIHEWPGRHQRGCISIRSTKYYRLIRSKRARHGLIFDAGVNTFKLPTFLCWMPHMESQYGTELKSFMM